MEQGWPQVVGQILGTAVVLVLGLYRRRAQNRRMTSTVAGELAKAVTEVREQVSHLKNAIAIHKDELHLVSDRETLIISRIDRLEKDLPRIEEICRQTMSFFERNKKAEPLETKPLPGGKTAIKTRKD